MGKGKRITLTILAWMASHFTLHIAFAAANNNNPPDGLIALINICIAGTVYYSTRKKDKSFTQQRTLKSYSEIFPPQSTSKAKTEKSKKCPFCAETIKFEAIKCRYCKEMLDRTETKKKPPKIIRQTADSRDDEKIKKRFKKQYDSKNQAKTATQQTPKLKPNVQKIKKQEPQKEFKKKVLCCHDACVGFLKENGRCGVCGKKPVPKTNDIPKKKLQIGSLTLCGDSQCIGTIGTDGKCKRCGKS